MATIQTTIAPEAAESKRRGRPRKAPDNPALPAQTAAKLPPDLQPAPLVVEKRSYRLTGISPILGSAPASEDIYTQFIASKAPDPALGEEEVCMLPEDVAGVGLTVFLRNENNRDELGIMSYVFRGYLKGTILALSAQNGILNAKSKVDRYLFAQWYRATTPGERFIPFIRDDGEIILDEDDQLERPLRAQTMQGERNALAASERIQLPWALEITLTLLPNAGTAKSRPITWPAIEQALDYGQYCGLGQWRNSGCGMFTWERIA